MTDNAGGGLPVVSRVRRCGAARVTGKGAGLCMRVRRWTVPAPRIAAVVVKATAGAGARAGRSAGEDLVNVFSYKELRGDSSPFVKGKWGRLRGI